ncbi:SEFIR domain-containing protein [Amycolatopsis sp. NPDC051102]|uniref:SEFIR domain-containing protein n=1 Tax=Amycolatopsis sp. NPDC051102 TaxID=3155163 RepID=UPI0034392E96
MLAEPAGPVGLVLVRGAPRHLSHAPAAIEIGAVRLGGWQVHRVVPAPAGFPGYAAHLVQINFDLWLAPDVPVPPWLEVGFAFEGGETHRPVVVDAVPRAAGGPQPETGFTVDRHLSFVATPSPAGHDVHLPGISAPVRVFGRGSGEIRWRLGDPEPGSYTAWITVLTAADATEVAVTASARYDLPPAVTFGDAPATVPRTFRLDLAARAADVAASPATPPRAAGPGDPPRVFLSYAHEDSAHIAKVVALAEFLVSCGLDVHMDRWDLEIARDWYVWALRQLKAADYVLVIASPACRAVGDGETDDTRNRGLQSEMSVLRELVHTERSRSTRRILRVVLPGRSPDEIPLFLQPHTVDHFRVDSFSVEGAEDLVRVLTGQPPYPRPAGPADVIALPPRPS